MNTLHHTETEEAAAPQSGTSRTTKIVIAGLIALGILDAYQDYLLYADKPSLPVAEVRP